MSVLSVLAPCSDGTDDYTGSVSFTGLATNSWRTHTLVTLGSRGGISRCDGRWWAVLECWAGQEARSFVPNVDSAAYRVATRGVTRHKADEDVYQSAEPLNMPHFEVTDEAVQER